MRNVIVVCYVSFNLVSCWFWLRTHFRIWYIPTRRFHTLHTGFIYFFCTCSRIYLGPQLRNLCTHFLKYINSFLYVPDRKTRIFALWGPIWLLVTIVECAMINKLGGGSASFGSPLFREALVSRTAIHLIDVVFPAKDFFLSKTIRLDPRWIHFINIVAW